MTADRGRQRGGLPWLAALRRGLSTRRSPAAAGMCAAINALAGVVLLAAAALIATGEMTGAGWSAAVFGGAGVVLLSGPALIRGRPDAAFQLLACHGFLFGVVGTTFAVTSIAWTFQAPANAPFRYVPGATFALLWYGILQVAAFGPWPGGASRLRSVGVWSALIAEAALLVGLLLRASRLGP